MSSPGTTYPHKNKQFTSGRRHPSTLLSFKKIGKPQELRTSGALLFYSNKENRMNTLRLNHLDRILYAIVRNLTKIE
jgi:hypothetical protein